VLGVYLVVVTIVGGLKEILVGCDTIPAQSLSRGNVLKQQRLGGDPIANPGDLRNM
jgi:hypothetical protein